MRVGAGVRLAAAGSILAVVAMLAACGDSSPIANQREVDIARAAEEAQNSVDEYAADRRDPVRPAPSARPRAKPTRAAAPSSPSTTVTEARYSCAGMKDIGIRFDNRADTATLRLPTRTVSLSLGEGVGAPFYAGDGYEFHGEGREATLVRPGAAAVTCTALD